MKTTSAIMVIMLSTLFVVLALQAEPVTATLGFVAAGTLGLALVVSFLRN